MNKTAANVAVLTAAVGLVGLGANTIGADLLAGAVEIVLGIALIILYEKMPVSR